MHRQSGVRLLQLLPYVPPPWAYWLPYPPYSLPWPPHLSQHVHIGHDGVQQRLQGIQPLVINIQHGLIPVIPISEAEEQADCGKHRKGYGKHNLKNMVNCLAPSIFADSISSSGTVVLKKVLHITTLKDDTARGNMSAHTESFRFKN